MAAVAHASPADIRRLALVRVDSYVPAVPARTPAVVYRRRRVVAVLAVASALAVLVLAIGALQASFVANGGATSGRLGSPGSPGAVYVVQPGDTFWDIARRLDPAGDPRPLVARLVAAHGSPVLVAGERLALPAAA